MEKKTYVWVKIGDKRKRVKTTAVIEPIKEKRR